MSASKDDTLYEPQGKEQRNNGAGEWFFSGQTGGADVRRGLIAFDIAAGIPAGATVTGVSLTLNMSRTIAGEIDIRLHRLLDDWQEGAGQGFGNEGSGASAVPGDVTWNYRVFMSLDWSTPGGNFFPVASATVTVGGPGSYTWQSSGLVANVQKWLDDPTTNFGWVLLGDETKSRTTKRFDSKENEKETNRPVLVVEYTPS